MSVRRTFESIGKSHTILESPRTIARRSHRRFRNSPNISSNTDSQRRYVERDVNIHYKTPVCFEYKAAVPELELAEQQARYMRRLYADERHRKYLQELQDQTDRRHADYYAGSQSKSPVALNRYDDYGAGTAVAPTNGMRETFTPPRIITRALYNFQGLTPR